MAELDFSKIRRRSTSDSATEPRRIFAALPSKEGRYGYARDVQSEVWEAWHERRDERDLVLKMNTGGGKTVVGLVVLKSCLNEGVGPVVYIAPDRYLVDQVRQEARRLGLDTTDDPGSASFQQGRAILVVTAHKLFNGRSVFGVRGRRASTELGAVLIDDAHACVATVEQQFRLSVEADHPAYEQMVTLFERQLRAQSPAAFRDIQDGDDSAVLQVPPWAWVDQQAKVMAILHPHRDEDKLGFHWPLIAEALPICRVAMSASAIEIAPPCPPVDMLPSFVRARRRLYLTATLADDSILVTHFAADAESVRVPVTPRSADDLGDRMILTPQQTFPHADEVEIRQLVVDHAERHNVVVIVPSWSRARDWEPLAAAVHGADTLHEGLDALRRRHVGLVVLVNKYDGIDLPGTACRLLVLDGLPEALGLLDRLDTVALDGSDAVLTRQVQRIEQGMGRGVRSNDDFCVVLLLGKRLTARLYRPAARAKLSPATRAQLELSDEIANMLRGKPFPELSGVIEQCLQRDPDWVAAARDALDGLRYEGENSISEMALARREAFDVAQAHRYREASERLQGAIDVTRDKPLRGWLKQEAAAYLQHVDAVAAQQLQTSAVADNRDLVKPLRGVSYARIAAPGEQAKAAATHLRDRYDTPEDLIIGIEGLLEQLEPDPDPEATRRFEQAFYELGRHLGLGAQRPEQEHGRGPDVLWQLGRLKFLVIECKSGSQAESVARKDASQLSHSMDWFEETYDTPCKATPVLVHPTRQLHGKASARAGTRIMTFEDLGRLREAVGAFATAVAHDSAYARPKAVAQHLEANRLNSGAFVEHWSRAPRSARS